jgi:molybdopterin converting factor small subunit
VACANIHLNALRQTDASGLTNLFNRTASKLNKKIAVIEELCNDMRNVISINEMQKLVSQLPSELHDLKERIFAELRNSRLLVAAVNIIKVEPK